MGMKLRIVGRTCCWATLILIAWSCAVLGRQTILSAADTKTVTDLYERAAFSRPDGRLVRPVVAKRYLVNLSCYVKSCMDTSQALKQNFGNGMFDFSAEEFVPGAHLNVVEYESTSLADSIENLEKRRTTEGENYDVDGEARCRSVSRFRNHSVKEIVVLLKADLLPFEKEACILLQAGRGSGLLITVGFDEIAALARSKDKINLLNGFRFLLAMHYSSRTYPGMARREFTAELKQSMIDNFIQNRP